MLFRGFVGLLQLLWPFLKESMLQDGTFRDWLRRHRTSCIWITFQLIMFLTVLWMSDALRLERQAFAVLQRNHDILKTRHDTLQERYVELKEERDRERQRAEMLATTSSAASPTSAPTLGARSACDFFQLPVNPELPAFRPIGAQELRNRDVAVSILMSQNAELRQYARTISQNWEDAYTRYLASCGATDREASESTPSAP